MSHDRGTCLWKGRDQVERTSEHRQRRYGTGAQNATYFAGQQLWPCYAWRPSMDGRVKVKCHWDLVKRLDQGPLAGSPRIVGPQRCANHRREARGSGTWTWRSLRIYKPWKNLIQPTQFSPPLPYSKHERSGFQHLALADARRRLSSIQNGSICH